MQGLSPKHHAFVLAYIEGPTMGHAGKSAVKAGYSAKSAQQQGTLLLDRPDIREAIADIHAEATAMTTITKARVMAELGRVAFTKMNRIVEWKPTLREVKAADPEFDQPEVVEIGNTVRLLPSDQIDPDAMAAVAEISEGQHGVKVKMHPKVAALTELGRHLGIAQKIAHTGPDGTGPVETITREMTAEQAADFYRQTLDEG
jgi:phage terminase small subunit